MDFQSQSEAKQPTVSPLPSPPRVLWVTGYPGCGKTSLGDYLSKFHNYLHIDVDADLMHTRFVDGKANPDDPVLTGYLKTWGLYFSEGPAALSAKEHAADFAPFLDLILERANGEIGSGSTNRKNIVITQGMHRAGRDYVRERISTNVFVLSLAATDEFKCRRGLEKMNRYLEHAGGPEEYAGKTHADVFKERTGLELTESTWREDWSKRYADKIGNGALRGMDLDEDEISSEGGINLWLDEIQTGADPMLIFGAVEKTLGLPAAVPQEGAEEGSEDLLTELWKQKAGTWAGRKVALF